MAPPQTSIPVAATVLSTIGTVLWCVQLIPQIWTNWRSKTTEGLPAIMMMIWAVCMYFGSEPILRADNIIGAVPFGVYAIVQVG